VVLETGLVRLSSRLMVLVAAMLVLKVDELKVMDLKLLGAVGA
jgi:hypothetical protein